MSQSIIFINEDFGKFSLLSRLKLYLLHVIVQVIHREQTDQVKLYYILEYVLKIKRVQHKQSEA